MRALGLAVVAVLLVIVAAVFGGLAGDGPQPTSGAAPPTGAADGVPGTSSAAPPTAPPATQPTPLPDGYTFYDDFDGDALSAVWSQHFDFDGIENTWASSQATVAGGMLRITAERTATGWVSQLLDTKTTWTQRYGRFEARMKIPRGAGLWPAFWSYRAGGGTESEIDAMEVCANPVELGRRNDVTLLHTTVRWTRGQAGGDTRVPDLSGDFHVYGVDWRPDRIAFFLDDREVWRFDDPARIPDQALPLIVDLAVGGTWCGPSDATTPDGAVLLVDWIRATR